MPHAAAVMVSFVCLLVLIILLSFVCITANKIMSLSCPQNQKTTGVLLIL